MVEKFSLCYIARVYGANPGVFLGGAKGNGRVIVGPEEDTFPPKPIVRLLDGVHEHAEGLARIGVRAPGFGDEDFTDET